MVPGVGGEIEGGTVVSTGFLFGSDKHAHKLESGDGCTRKPLHYTFARLNFMPHELYLNKAIILKSISI